MLGGFEALGLFDELFGRLRGTRLQLPDDNRAIGLRRGAGIGAPSGDGAYSQHDDGQGDSRDRDRLSADTARWDCYSGSRVRSCDSKSGRNFNVPE